MKQLLITFSIFLHCVVGIGQNGSVKIDTFYSNNGLTSFRLLICSDSSFYSSSNNCTDANISKGKWKAKGDRLFLFPDKINSGIVESDTIVTFEVLDCFKNPIIGYTMTFYDKDMKAQDFYTNDSGKIFIPQNTYTAYLTKDDYKNIEYPTELTSMLRFLWQKYSRITLTLNYPSYILNQRNALNAVTYENESWIKTKEGLSSLPGLKFSLKKLQ